MSPCFREKIRSRVSKLADRVSIDRIVFIERDLESPKEGKVDPDVSTTGSFRE